MQHPREKEISRDGMLASFPTGKALTDVTLKGRDGVEVPANRFLLSARSQVFRGMLLGGPEVSSLGVELDFQGSVLRAVVEYIYTDSAPMLNCKKRKSPDTRTFDFEHIQSLVSLAAAASHFQLSGLGKLVLKNFKQIWAEYPCWSFAVLQACRMAGPSVPWNLLVAAWTRVRVTPTETITKEHIHCLSPDVLEEILKDPKMQLTEYQLFQILNLWRGGQADVARIHEDSDAETVDEDDEDDEDIDYIVVAILSEEKVKGDGVLCTICSEIPACVVYEGTNTKKHWKYCLTCQDDDFDGWPEKLEDYPNNQHPTCQHEADLRKLCCKPGSSPSFIDRSLDKADSIDEGDRSSIAKTLSKHLYLEKIDPKTLSTTVTGSGLVTSGQLLEAFKQQALEMMNQGSASANWSQVRYKPKVTEIPDAPTEIEMERTSSESVKGDSEG
ncbi:expressed unknown protein [Seminavis robusta]|uniref:BTB domain-containing protein n=1 Tax=Seminavis robusta TaxID=568900 RepID=A0A9N8DDH0_9STRA|nr:expressed unknown protein [Seminavis robusta]|eukprot:Sro68_g038330.1 n/a (442) ;mRNA; r:121129-122454